MFVRRVVKGAAVVADFLKAANMRNNKAMKLDVCGSLVLVL